MTEPDPRSSAAFTTTRRPLAPASSAPFSHAAPAVSMLRNRHPVLWRNPARQPPELGTGDRVEAVTLPGMLEARRRLLACDAFLAAAFPQIRACGGRLESPLIEVPALSARLLGEGIEVHQPLLVKCDQRLPVSGSSDVRAAALVLLDLLEAAGSESVSSATVISPSLDPPYPSGPMPTGEIRGHEGWRRALQGRRIVLGGPSNLWLALACLACPLGCEVEIRLQPGRTVPEWKIERALLAGATVRRDHAAEPGRPDARDAADTLSVHRLMTGYATAALELAEQFQAAALVVDDQHPLFVYLPGGNGLAAAAIAAGLRLTLGEHVHCFVGDTANHPALALALLTARLSRPAQTILTGRTRIEGFDGGCTSRRVLSELRRNVAGCFTAVEEYLFAWLFEAHRLEGLRLEPAAAVGFAGLERLLGRDGQRYLEEFELTAHLSRAHHLVWAGSGGLVPTDVFTTSLETGRPLAEASRNKFQIEA